MHRPRIKLNGESHKFAVAFKSMGKSCIQKTDGQSPSNGWAFETRITKLALCLAAKTTGCSKELVTFVLVTIVLVVSKVFNSSGRGR